MEYRKIGDNYYIRMDRGDEIISNLLEICEKESIPSAVFSGIGGYIGESTRREIAYAEKSGKKVNYLENDKI